MSTLEMELRAFETTDIHEVNSWYIKRNGISDIKQYLSSTGIIAPGIAVGFLIKTDAYIGILEPFISNPAASLEHRDEALKAILDRLTVIAKESGCLQVYGFSTNKRMLDRAMAQGFEVKELNSTTVVKRL